MTANNSHHSAKIMCVREYIRSTFTPVVNSIEFSLKINLGAQLIITKVKLSLGGQLKFIRPFNFLARLCVFSFLNYLKPLARNHGGFCFDIALVGPASFLPRRRGVVVQ